MAVDTLILRIKERLQLALLMSIFFPTLLGVYFAAVSVPPDQIANIELNWSILIVFYLVGYLIIDGSKQSNMREGVLRGMSRSVFVGIALFVVPISYLIAFHTPGVVSAPTWIVWTDKSIFEVAIQGLQLIALIVMIFAIVAASWKMPVGVIK